MSYLFYGTEIARETKRKLLSLQPCNNRQHYTLSYRSIDRSSLYNTCYRLQHFCGQEHQKILKVYDAAYYV